MSHFESLRTTVAYIRSSNAHESFVRETEHVGPFTRFSRGFAQMAVGGSSLAGKLHSSPVDVAPILF